MSDNKQDLRILRLYEVSRKGSTKYDEHHGFVVAAYNEEDAREVAQGGASGDSFPKKQNQIICNWLGVAALHVERGVILDSFRGA